MRKIITTMQVSLDGLAERANRRTDFIGTGQDTFDWDLFDRADTCVLGRVMYSEYEKYWRTIAAQPAQALELTGARPTADEIRYAEFANSTPHYVLSKTVSDLDWPAAKPVADLDAIRALRDTGTGVIYLVGGPSTLGAFIEHGLLDELRITIHPVLIGGGLPLFGNLTSEHRFDFVEAIPLREGRVRLVYRRS